MVKTGEQQYLDILQDILVNGVWKDSARKNMPRTKEVFCRTMAFDLSNGFPVFTTKKMAWKTSITELTWFLRGDTNIKYLLDNNCGIWTDDAYRFYKEQGGTDDKDTWVQKVRDGIENYGDCGAIYGHQWCNFDDNFNQLQYVIESIKSAPNSRYHIMSIWNPVDFLQKRNSALPTCHLTYQFSVRGEYLDMVLVQRSCDMLLGVPFDVLSGSLFLTLMANHTGYKPGVFNWVGHSCHIYENHVDQALTIISRIPYKFPELQIINKHDDITQYTRNDFALIDYKYHDKVDITLNTGL